jgi:hypothetical protein
MTRLELERERALLAALRGLARDLKEPSFDPQREEALLAIFDEASARRTARRQAPVWTGLAAAALIFGAVLTWQFANRPGAPGIAAPPTAIVAPEISFDATDFVAWPGATAWPPFESGELIRVEFPVDDGVVEADVIVGQDGFARAIRLVR